MHYSFASMTKTVDKIYKRSFTDAYFFGWINSIRKNLPTVSIEKAVLNFMNEHDLTDADVCMETIVSKFKRMNDEYFESQKTKEVEGE